MPLWLTIGLEIVKVVIGGGALFSVGIAYKAYKANLLKQDEDRARDSDKELLTQSQKSLEWAYDVLTNIGKNLPPDPDRLNWLTCARHIKRHDELALKIKSATYRTVHADIEEFWRHRFYVALNNESLMKASYYGSVHTSTPQEQIELISALVVLTFARWKEDAVDPLDIVEKADLIGSGDVFKSAAGRGLQSYMSERDNWRATRNAQAVAPREVQ